MKYNIQLLADDGYVLAEESWQSIDAAGITLRQWADMVARQKIELQCWVCMNKFECDEDDVLGLEVVDETIQSKVFDGICEECEAAKKHSDIAENEATGN